MKKGWPEILRLILPITLLVSSAAAQVDSGKLQRALYDSNGIRGLGTADLKSAREFYRYNGYRPSWIGKNNTATMQTLLHAMEQGEDMGIRKGNYLTDTGIRNFLYGNVLNSQGDSAETEIRITATAIHFFRDVAMGSSTPSLGYNGLAASSVPPEIPSLLAQRIREGKLNYLLWELSPSIPDYGVMAGYYKSYLETLADSSFKDIRVSPIPADSLNMPLMQRMAQLKITSDSGFEKLIRSAQKRFNLPETGKLSKLLVNELNVPLATRLKQLEGPLNDYRWLNNTGKGKHTVVVNIPATLLKVYKDNYPVLQMRMVVGKKKTPTPTLSSTIKEVILYPYWHVPYSIATKEILPILKRNPGYIQSGNYQVLNRSGNIVDPYSVDWKSLGPGNFPYLIRQSTGCDNSLGLIKLDFYNPFGVYLHDTPSKGLFSKKYRFFSHGCMRMEKPMELGRIALSNNRVAIDTLEQKGCLSNRNPIMVHADIQMPVVVWYHLAGTDEQGNLVFYGDIYETRKGVMK